MKIKLTEDMEGLLVEFDEHGFAPTITMPNAEEYAKAWKNSLVDLFERMLYEKEKLRNSKVIYETVDYCAEDLKKAQAEIKRLKQSNKNILFVNEQEIKRNEELQKQVDELKNRFENKACCNMSENCSMIQQAVKDTAKEIFIEIFESCVFNFKGNEDYKNGFCDALEQYDKQLRDLAKQKGVEVE